MALRTEYEFFLPRGYLDQSGTLHKRGTMRLATARDELEPLRDPFVTGPDDPRLTILVLARVVLTLGTVPLVSTYEIENLFAADLAYLQDFYGVINFGTPEEIDALLTAQDEAAAAERAASAARAPSEAPPAPSAATAAPAGAGSGGSVPPAPSASETSVGSAHAALSEPRPAGRRAAIEEVPSSDR